MSERFVALKRQGIFLGSDPYLDSKREVEVKDGIRESENRA